MKTADPITNSHLASTYHGAGTLQTPQGVYDGGNSTIIEIKVEGHALPKVTQRGQWQAGCECFPEPRYSSLTLPQSAQANAVLGTFEEKHFEQVKALRISGLGDLWQREGAEGTT